jgi:hypothetical protein
MALTLEQRFSEAERNEQYALREFSAMRSRYRDEYVGILDGEVRYHDKDLDKLLAAIRADRGSTLGVFVLFVPDRRATIVV